MCYDRVVLVMPEVVWERPCNRPIVTSKRVSAKTRAIGVIGRLPIPRRAECRQVSCSGCESKRRTLPNQTLDECISLNSQVHGDGGF